jgi:cytochrome c oxidase cbb3-type subunit 3
MTLKQVFVTGFVLLNVAAIEYAQAPSQAGGRAQSPAAQRPPQTATPQTYTPEQVQLGQARFIRDCGFCHGRDAAGGEGGPDLTRSVLVAQDFRADKIGPVVRSGRTDRGMPGFEVSDADLLAIAAFIHDQKTKAESQAGGRRGVDVADLQTGDAEAGRRYFDGAGGCAKCHSPEGDLAGVARRYQGLQLIQRMLYPPSVRPSPAAPKVVVTLPSGENVAGDLAYRDEFTIAVTDSTGWYRSFDRGLVKFTIDDAMSAHFDQLDKYTDRDMHNVFAYLQTLR